MELIPVVRAVQRRLRLGEALTGTAVALVVFAVTLLLATLGGLRDLVAAALAFVSAAVVLAVSSGRALSRWTPEVTAVHIETASGGLDNLLVTATALSQGTLQASRLMASEVARHASDRTATIRPDMAAPLGVPAALALAALIGAAGISWSTFERRSPDRVGTPVPAGGAISQIRATITAPAYMARAPQTVDNPEQVLVPEGGRLRIDVSSTAREAWLVEPGLPARGLKGERQGQFAAEWVPAASSGVVIAVGQQAGEPEATRIVNVVVVPDRAPRVRIVSPARDLGFARPEQSVDIAIDADDAEGLTGLRLAYVRMSGSGESFTFAESEIPVTVDKTSEHEWRGRARLLLSSLKLQDGDSIVYRALVRDSNPDAGWVESESYTIDVGKRLEFASAGSALPDEDRRYALSQQMVIVKTERLQAERGRLDADTWTERTRLLAMEQRMVRGEVVFLSGGEVEDEAVEAAQSNELQEGRLQNAGRAEMLRAINEMSRAEARLNAGDMAGALVFERSALAALQRAFDRRRYFLRTLGERSKIDPSRRLTGDSSKATPAARDPRRETESQLELARRLARELAEIAASGNAPDANLLGQLASMETASDDWRELAASLAAAVTPDARRTAAEQTMVRLAAYARARSGASIAAPAFSELHGWWREETRPGERR